MIKRKISGQTIAIIILAIILLITVAFGSVYANMNNSSNLTAKEDNAEFSPLNFEMERINNQYAYSITFYYKNNSDQEIEVDNLIIVLKKENDIKRLKCDSFIVLPQSNKYVKYEYTSSELYFDAYLLLQNEFGIEKEINNDRLSFNYILYPVWFLMVCSFVLFYISYRKLELGKRYLYVTIPSIILLVFLIQIDKFFNSTWIIGFFVTLASLIIPVVDKSKEFKEKGNK